MWVWRVYTGLGGSRQLLVMKEVGQYFERMGNPQDRVGAVMFITRGRP